MAKIAGLETISKAKPRWQLALWLGRLETNDSHMLLTENGLETARSVRRLAAPDCYQADFLLKLGGNPLVPKDRNQSKASSSSSTSNGDACPSAAHS